MNIPASKLDVADAIMVVGMGGGFDVFTGLPFVYAHPDKKFVLVNSGPDSKLLYRKSLPEDLPEGAIRPIPNVEECYTLGRVGVHMAKKAYQEIIDKHNIQCVLGVDGGVDSLMTGDEEESGTILEDFIGIAALDEIKGVDKLICNAGFGTETEENVNHYRVLENIAALAGDGSFLGSFSLTKGGVFDQYKAECENAWAGGKRKSHIQTKIISAVEGRFDKNNAYADIDCRLEVSTGVSFVSPLSSIFWMFDFDGVARRNKAISLLKKGATFTDCKMLLKQFFMGLSSMRPKCPLPL